MEGLWVYRPASGLAKEPHARTPALPRALASTGPSCLH